MPRNKKAKSKQRPLPTVAVIGYGPQGRAIALNLQDAGFGVIVGLRPRSRSRTKAWADGIKKVETVARAVVQADLICFAFPDHRHETVFAKSIAPALRPGSTLWFLHGTSIHFGFVKPPMDCDVILVAPHAPGDAVRREYLGRWSLSGFYGVHQNFSGRAVWTARLLARGIGLQRKNLLKTTFEHEAVGDLFGEQVVLCGGLAALIQGGFQTLVAQGWKPEHAWLEVAYQLDLIVDLIKERGITGMLRRISPAARFGSLEAGPKIVDRGTRRRMKQILADIRSGRFAWRLRALDDEKLRAVDRALVKLSDPHLERAARKFRR